MGKPEDEHTRGPGVRPEENQLAAGTKHTHRLRDTLAAVAAKLPPGRFLRISRSTLVNVEHIMGVQRMFFDEYEVLLRNGARLPLTRAYLENLRQIGLSLPALTPPVNSSRLTLGSPASNC